MRSQTREDRVVERAFRRSFIHLFATRAPLCERTKHLQRTSRKKEQERDTRGENVSFGLSAERHGLRRWRNGNPTGKTYPKGDRKQQARAFFRARLASPRCPQLSAIFKPMRPQGRTARYGDSRSPRSSREPFVGITKLTLRPLAPRICGCLTGSLRIRCFVQKLSKSALRRVDPGGLATRSRLSSIAWSSM